MKRFFVSIITICCLVSSVSAGSLLFTPHHVSNHSQIFSDNIQNGSFSFHVDAEGKGGSIDVANYSFIKLKQSNSSPFWVFKNIPDLELIASDCKIFTYFSFEDHRTNNRRTILFPFHSFL